jgi:hypothetical protein
LSELIEIEKADVVVFLLDGGRLANPVERAGAFQAVRQGIRAFTDGNLLTRATELQVVITKSDLLQHAPDVDALEVRIVQFQQNLNTDLANRLGKLSYWRIAARDPSGHMAPAHGMSELLQDWTTPRVSQRAPAITPKNLTTELDKLLVRAGIEELP